MQNNPIPATTQARFDKASFVEKFANCFRGGAALAGRAYEEASGTLVDSQTIFSALRQQFRAAGDAEKFELLKHYTPLDPAIKSAEIVADETRSERLSRMTAYQQGRLLDMLAAYRKKFGFDAIFVVRAYTTAELLASLEVRVVGDHQAELAITYSEVERLAQIQVEAQFT